MSPSFAPGSSRLPRPQAWSKKRKATVFGGLGLVLLVGLPGIVWRTFYSGRDVFTGPTAEVKRKVLQITVIARGSLESVKNNDILCLVRSGIKGSTNATTIKDLVDNGAWVEKGEKVIILDDSGLQEQLKAQQIDVDNANSAMQTAKEKYTIDKIQGDNDEQKAINARDLAQGTLDKYLDGDFQQLLKDVNGRIQTSQSDLDDWKERANWTLRMYKKGLMSKVQADADASRVEASTIALDKVNEEKRVLVNYTKKLTEQDLRAKLEEAKLNLEKTKIQTKSQLAADDADRKSKQSVYDMQMAKYKDYQEQIQKCVVLAPQSGLVVYYVPEQVRGGGGTQQSIIAQGEPVRESQKMMQIPDLEHMRVNVRVPEAMVSVLYNEVSPDDPSTWQMATIKVDAFPNHTYKGHIKIVDTMASQQDMFASDVKVYKTLVSIDDALTEKKLKPGMSAEVTVHANHSGTPVLVVPVQAVVGTIASGASRKVFVIASNGRPEMRDIVVGMSNEREVEVKEGLTEGERVVENPRPLLGENSELKQGKVRSVAPEDQQDDSKGKKGGPKKAAAPGGDGKAGLGSAPAGGAAAEKQAKQQMFLQYMQDMSAEQRRDFINNIPDAAKQDEARKLLKANNLAIAN